MGLGWLSPQTLVALVAMLIFAALCVQDMRRAILVFTVVGCIRSVQIGAFAGSEVVQGLFPVEGLATVMFLTWCVTRKLPIRRMPFNWPLFLLLPASVVSLVAGFSWYDPTIPLDHMKLSVSFGQILLTLWPIATYMVVANSVHRTRTIETISKTIVVLALPSLLLLVWPSAWPYVDWSMAFALPASSLSFAELLHTRSLPKRLGLFVLTVAPAGYGVQMDKAFYYSYVVVSVCVIACFEARRFVMVMASVVFATYVMAAPVLSSSLTPQFFERLVKSEEEQQSLGGSGGRDRLIEDGLGIWSRYPGLGVGPGNNYPYMLRYSSLGTAHNQYINILIELGVVGLACLLAFAVQAIRVGVRVWRSARERVHRTLALAWLGLFSGMLVGGFFGDFMLPSIRNSGLELFAEFYVQWIILGLLVSASAIERWHTVRAAA